MDEISHLIAKEGTQVIDHALDLVHRQDVDNEMNKPTIVLALPTAGDTGALATSSTAQEKKAPGFICSWKGGCRRESEETPLTFER
jgi:hypothetical protein